MLLLSCRHSQKTDTLPWSVCDDAIFNVLMLYGVEFAQPEEIRAPLLYTVWRPLCSVHHSQKRRLCWNRDFSACQSYTNGDNNLPQAHSPIVLLLISSCWFYSITFADSFRFPFVLHLPIGWCIRGAGGLCCARSQRCVLPRWATRDICCWPRSEASPISLAWVLKVQNWYSSALGTEVKRMNPILTLGTRSLTCPQYEYRLLYRHLDIYLLTLLQALVFVLWKLISSFSAKVHVSVDLTLLCCMSKVHKTIQPLRHRKKS